MCENEFVFVCLSAWQRRVVCGLSVAREGSTLPGPRRAASPSQAGLTQQWKAPIAPLLGPVDTITQQPPPESLVKVEEERLRKGGA